MTRRDDDLDLLLRLRATIREVVGRYLAPGSRVAYINYPSITNVGDPALWLGAWNVLRELDVRVVYACDARSYDPQELANAEGPDWVVINGGGNFGDLWRGQQQTRERVLRDRPDVPTLQLPQSVWFEDEANLERVGTLMRRHEGLHLLWRDGRSLAFAEDNLPGRHAACPDTALALEPQERVGPHRVDVLWLRRTDKERRYASVPALGGGISVEVTDWVDPDHGASPRASERLALLVQDRLGQRLHHRQHDLLARFYRATFEPVASYHLHRGLAILSRGRIVVTDRLHAHILCVLAGIPHIVLDNSYGKVRAVYDSWTSEASTATFVDGLDQVPQVVRRLLEGV